MKFALKILIVAVITAALFAAGYKLWGREFEALFSQ